MVDVMANKFVNLMVMISDCSNSKNCEIVVGAFKRKVYVEFRKGEKRIKHTFTAETLKVVDERMIKTILEEAYKELCKGE